MFLTLLLLYRSLREKFQKLIIQHPSFGSFVTCKETEEKLWKLCFYVKIEEYRKSIRKTVLLRDSDEGPAANQGESSRVIKAKTHLAKLISAFSKFLSDGTSFYQEFMLKVRVTFL
jgi:Telomerase activating protein Est1